MSKNIVISEETYEALRELRKVSFGNTFNSVIEDLIKSKRVAIMKNQK